MIVSGLEASPACCTLCFFSRMLPIWHMSFCCADGCMTTCDDHIVSLALPMHQLRTRCHAGVLQRRALRTWRTVRVTRCGAGGTSRPRRHHSMAMELGNARKGRINVTSSLSSRKHGNERQRGSTSVHSVLVERGCYPFWSQAQKEATHPQSA